VPKVSIAVLKRNLATHAACSPTVVAAGIKPEMVERIRGIFVTWKMDLLGRRMNLRSLPLSSIIWIAINST
jgi:hypothetical protein